MAKNNQSDKRNKEELTSSGKDEQSFPEKKIVFTISQIIQMILFIISVVVSITLFINSYHSLQGRVDSIEKRIELLNNKIDKIK